MLAIGRLPTSSSLRGSSVLLRLGCREQCQYQQLHHQLHQHSRCFSVTLQRPCKTDHQPPAAPSPTPASPQSPSPSPSPSPSRRRSGLSALLRSRTGADQLDKDIVRPVTNLPNRPARTRFAPSPTGYLHMGGLRTALYNYLLAKATNGQFILRVEDTDRKRVVHDAQSRLLDDLRWAHVEWDEGPDVGGPYGPYCQSERLDVYKSHVDKLIQSGHAYRCFCSPQELEKQRMLNVAQGLGTGYLGTCRAVDPEESASRAASGEEHCVRFKVGHDRISFFDRVYGHYEKKEEEGGDFIIIKRDGYPTYHFANVVDDHLMKITHVVRGEEWLISTPKHIALYRAFGWEPPEFAHVGLLVNEKGKKLSKRDMDTDVTSFKPGVLPQPFLVWLAQLGSHFSNPSMTNMESLVAAFTNKFTRGRIKINPPKLTNIQQTYLDHLFGEEEQPWHKPGREEVVSTLQQYVHDLDDSKEGTTATSSSGRVFERAQWGSLVPDSELADRILSLFAPPRRPRHPLLTDYVLERPEVFWKPLESES